VQEVLKREVVEGEKADEARKKLNKAASRLLRTKSSKPAIERPVSPASAKEETELEEDKQTEQNDEDTHP
jgi:hypothetical protein